MKKTHKITDEHIRSSFGGYYNFYPTHSENIYYKVFEDTWNDLAHDIRMCQLNNKQLISSELLNAERQINQLFEQMAIAYDRLSKRLETLKTNISKCDTQKDLDVKLKKASTMVDLSIRLYCSGAFIKNAFEIIKNYKGNTYSESLEKISQEFVGIEKIIKQIALIHAQHTGLKEALSHYDTYGQLPYFGDSKIDKPETNAFSHSNLTNCTVKDLFNIGHSLREAICIRFLSLNKNYHLPQYDAYCKIQMELEESRLFMEDFPAESKILADRARRLENKRYEEIRLINKHFTAPSE